MIQVYIASSWRNPHHERVVSALASLGLSVFNYRKAGPKGDGFSWSEIDDNWRNWDLTEYGGALASKRGQEAFRVDMGGLEAASIVVLVMPSGISSHLELGYAAGAGKATITEPPQIDLMANMASHIILGMPKLLAKVEEIAANITRMERSLAISLEALRYAQR